MKDDLCVSLFNTLCILIHARQRYCQIKDDFQFLSSVFFEGQEKERGDRREGRGTGMCKLGKGCRGFNVCCRDVSVGEGGSV